MIFKLYSMIMIVTVISLFFLSSGCSKDADALQSAPGFTLKDLSGNSISLKQYAGNIVLLDFWATWCPPCRQSIPELVSLQNKYGNQGVVILGISLDDPQQFNDNYLSAFKQQFKINYKKDGTVFFYYALVYEDLRELE